MATSNIEVDLLEDGELPSSDEEEANNNDTQLLTDDNNTKPTTEQSSDDQQLSNNNNDIHTTPDDQCNKHKRPFESPSPPNSPLSAKNNESNENEIAKKKPKLDTSDGEEGEIFSDDEEAAYYPQLVKKREESSFNKNDDSPSKGYTQDGRYGDRDDHTPHKGHRFNRGRWRDRVGAKSHGDLIGPPIRHNNDKKWEEPRSNSYATPTLTLEVLESRLSRHLALLPTPQMSQCMSLDEMNYPAPPQWYMKAVSAYNRKRQARQREEEEEDNLVYNNNYGEQLIHHHNQSVVSQPPMQQPAVHMQSIRPPAMHQPVPQPMLQPVLQPVPMHQPVRQPMPMSQPLRPPMHHQPIHQPMPTCMSQLPLVRQPMYPVDMQPVHHLQPVPIQGHIVPLIPLHEQSQHPPLPHPPMPHPSVVTGVHSSNDYIQPLFAPNEITQSNTTPPIQKLTTPTPTPSSHTELQRELHSTPSVVSKNSNIDSKNSNSSPSNSFTKNNDVLSSTSNPQQSISSSLPLTSSSLPLTSSSLPLTSSSSSSSTNTSVSVNKQQRLKRTMTLKKATTSNGRKKKKKHKKQAANRSLVVSIDLSLISLRERREREGGKESEDDYDDYLDQLNDEEELNEFDDNFATRGSCDFWIDKKPTLGDPLEDDFPLLGDDERGGIMDGANESKASLRSLVGEQSVDDSIKMMEGKGGANKSSTTTTKKKGLANMRIPRKKKNNSSSTATTTNNSNDNNTSLKNNVDTEQQNFNQLTTASDSSVELQQVHNSIDDESKQPCKYFLSGHCIHGDTCQFSHLLKREKKKDMCKFYLQDACDKGEDCLFYHGDFPCKYFHTRHMCYHGDKCKFSHAPLNEESHDILMNVLEPSMKEFVRYPPPPPPSQTHPHEGMPTDMRLHPSIPPSNFLSASSSLETTPINNDRPALKTNVPLPSDFDVSQLFPDEHPQVLPHQLATQLRKVLLSTPVTSTDNKESDLELEYWENEETTTKKEIPQEENAALPPSLLVDDPRKPHPTQSHPPIIQDMPRPPPTSVLGPPGLLVRPLFNQAPPPSHWRPHPPNALNAPHTQLNVKGLPPVPLVGPPPTQIRGPAPPTHRNPNIPIPSRGGPPIKETSSDPQAIDPRYFNRGNETQRHYNTPQNIPQSTTNSNSTGSNSRTHLPVKDSPNNRSSSRSPNIHSHWSSPPSNSSNSDNNSSEDSKVGSSRSSVQVRQKYSQFKIKPKTTSQSTESILKKTSGESTSINNKNLPSLLRDSAGLGKPLAPNELFGNETTPSKNDVQSITLFGSRQQIPDSPSFKNETFGEIKMNSDNDNSSENNNDRMGVAVEGGVVNKQVEGNVPSYLTHLGLGLMNEGEEEGGGGTLQIDSAFGSLQARQRRLSEISSIVSEDTTSQLSNPAHPATPTNNESSSGLNKMFSFGSSLF